MDSVELLFFDTFSHDISEELNLDLVQFPKPVYISEVRIIPLGARVQADFPGGVRLGATNPSQFEIEFFVNDLSKPGASTFESLGGLEYKQNVNIQLECERKQIPTDGLVLRGWYTTITLAVYGSLTKAITNPPEFSSSAPAAPVPVSVEPKPPTTLQSEETVQSNWYYENNLTEPQSVPEPELSATSLPIPQPIQTIGTIQKIAKPPESQQWIEESPKSLTTNPKKPASPPPESLVSLSPESISAEEEDDGDEEQEEEEEQEEGDDDDEETEREPEESVEAVEPFEPILSDEELMNDDIPGTSMDYQSDISAELHVLEPPDLLDLMSLPPTSIDCHKSESDDTDRIQEILKSFSKFFVRLNTAPGQEKESFVHNCELLCIYLGSSCHIGAEDLQNLSEMVNAGLDMELARAQPQPAYKVRHIKVGVRLAEATCALEKGSDVLLKVDAPRKLLTLCMRENVALPVKLAAIRALDAALISPRIIDNFLNSENNLYKITLLMLDEAKLARLKYALTSLLRKIHTYELLSEVKRTGLKEIEIIELTQAYTCAPTLMAQPKRQLPVSMQMEFEREVDRNPQKHLISYFRHYGLMKLVLLTLVCPQSSTKLIKAVRKFLIHLTETEEGLLYLLEDTQVTKSILKALRYNEPGLGSEIAWCLQVTQCLAHLKHSKISKTTNQNDWTIMKKLHSFLTYPEGLHAIISVVPIGSFIDILIPLLADRDLSEFSAEIISMTIKYSSRVEILQSRASSLLDASRTQVILRDISSHLNIAVPAGNWNYNDVSSLVSTIRKYSDKSSALPGELITSCRILYHLTFPSNGDIDAMESYVELKHRNVLTQLFAADGLTSLIAVLSNLTTYYEQPFLHRATLTGRRGLALVGLLITCVKLIRALLQRLVQCMATDFKNLTPVAPLLEVYCLADAIPGSHHFVKLLQEEIAETLLLFTRAVDSDGAGNVAKSLWTQMLGEVLRMISMRACNFLPGLKLLSRLLPPTLCKGHNHEKDVARALGLRKLWSAHLQAQAGNLTETLRLLCASWNEPLLTLLSTVCKQLSDLAAPTALLVGRCLLDRILTAAPLENNIPTLALLNDLTLHPPVKATLLTLLSPTSRAQVKSDQKYPPVVEMMCATLKNINDMNVQSEILEIFYTLCDDNLALVQSNATEPLEIRLTHSVPSKEPLISILTALIDILGNAGKNSEMSLEMTLRVLLSLTKHNYGLYHVKSCLENNPGALKAFLDHVGSLVQKEGDDSDSSRPLMMLTVSFLESLIACGKSSERSLYLRHPQLAALIMWEKNVSHPLQKIQGTQELVNDLAAALEGRGEKEPIPEMLEPLLPTPEALLNQFSQRSVKRPASLSPVRYRKHHCGSGMTAESTPVDLISLSAELLPADFNLLTEAQLLCSKAPLPDSMEPLQGKEGGTITKDMQRLKNFPINKTKQPFVTPMRGRAQFVSSRGGLSSGAVGGRGADPFRSRPPNTSRPPSLHVDDFVALETCGAQPTGPTGYNKLSIRGTGPPRGVISSSRCRAWIAEPRPPYLR
ncbi:protein virilizer [Diachasma alloeum]|uniref:protein virilizer n=1 Tax=Diachasma alloeum TaxID=454923 RepID=UPI00073839B3|nr:protein virilizer [Diachasma alloeum]XP_015122423.1 protein virilizer [Diachasma alloeum]